MNEFDVKKQQRENSLENQKTWKKNMLNKLGLSRNISNKEVYKELNHEIHPCFCKGKNLQNKCNKYRYKSETKNMIIENELEYDI